MPLSSSELIVSWSHPDIVPEYYRVQVSSPYKDEITYNTFHIVNELEPCSSYSVQVSSVYGNDNTYPDTTTGTTGSVGEFLPKFCCIVVVYLLLCYLVLHFLIILPCICLPGHCRPLALSVKEPHHTSSHKGFILSNSATASSVVHL